MQRLHTPFGRVSGATAAVSIALVGLILVALSGCAGMDGLFHEPTARVTSVDIARIDFRSVTLVVNVEIDNPNPLGLNLSAYDYGLDAWNASVVEGRQEDSVSLKADGVSVLPIPLELDFADLLTVGASSLSEDTVPLAIRLGLEMAFPYMGAIRLDLSAAAEIPVPRPPLVIPRSIRVDRIGLSGADITLVSEIRNANAFPLTVRTLAGGLSVGGRDWGGIGINGSVPLGAGERRSMEISARVDFGQVGQSAWNLLTGAGDANVDIAGTMDIDADLPGFDGAGIPWDADAKVSIVR